MKAQLVKEAIDFKRTGDSRKALKVGQWSRGEIERTLGEAILKLSKLGYFASTVDRDSKHFNFMLVEIQLEALITYKSAGQNLNGNFVIYYTDDSDGLKEYVGKNIDNEVVNENGPWILIDNRSEIKHAEYGNLPGRAYYNFINFDDLLKEFIKLDFKEPVEDWDWIEITKKRLAILDK